MGVVAESISDLMSTQRKVTKTSGLPAFVWSPDELFKLTVLISEQLQNTSLQKHFSVYIKQVPGGEKAGAQWVKYPCRCRILRFLPSALKQLYHRNKSYKFMGKVLWRSCNSNQYHLNFHFFLFSKVYKITLKEVTNVEVCLCIRILLQVPTGMTKHRKMHSFNEVRITLQFFLIRDFICNAFTRYSQII